MRASQIIATKSGQAVVSALLLAVVCPSIAFLVPPPILNRPVQPQYAPVQNSQNGVQAAQSESQATQPDQNEAHDQTFEGCGLNRDAAIMKAELLMTQALGEKTVSGHRTLNNDQYTRTVTENSTLLTNRPVTILEQWGGSGRVCVRIAP
jgi:hypothetical protein